MQTLAVHEEKEFGIALFPRLWLAGAWKAHIVAQSCSGFQG